MTLPASFRFAGGGDGHTDPFGAKAAGQARAGRIHDAAQIVEEEGARHHVRVSDFVLANDKIAVYVEAEGESDGYFPFGGEILAIEPVGEDGRPRGVSRYGESAFTIGLQTVAADSVTVMADGADGKAAVVRATGVLKTIPFLEPFRLLLAPVDYDLPVALDYVLEPGAERVVVRLSLANTKPERQDSMQQLLAFFHGSRSQMFTRGQGFAPPQGERPFVAWDSGASGFAIRTLSGPLRTEVSTAGLSLFSTKGLALDACSTKTLDYVEIVTGGPGIDGVLEATRRASGDPAWREVRGVVHESEGAVASGVFVHATSPDGSYVTRALSNAQGEFVMHLPAGSIGLTPTLRGWSIPPATMLADGATSADLVLAPRAIIDVHATDSVTNAPLPVRVQIIPAQPPTVAPETFGLMQEKNGRLWQEFAVSGQAKLSVPPGDHRVIVSRGYKYELVDQLVHATAGETSTVTASLTRSVPPDGTLCADFHVHASYSLDSTDDPDEKVKAAISDGLDIPVSSEHEYVRDFAPIIKRLGLGAWAFSLPSEELTTSTWGHFGVIPLLPLPERPNNGAISWVGRTPAQVFSEINALPEKPVIIVNHPSGGSFAAYFSAAHLDRAQGRGSAELWSDDFTAVEVFNASTYDHNRDSSVADWYALLLAGKTYWAVGNSDSHDQRSTHVGYPRTCLQLGTDSVHSLTVEAVRDALKSGAAVVEGGLTMSVEGPGGAHPGAVSTAGSYRVEVRAPSWIAARELEVIVDGITTQTLPLVAASAEPGPGKRYEVRVDVAPTSSRTRHFVVFHARGDGDLTPVHPGKAPFAVSNPIFF